MATLSEIRYETPATARRDAVPASDGGFEARGLRPRVHLATQWQGAALCGQAVPSARLTDDAEDVSCRRCWNARRAYVPEQPGTPPAVVRQLDEIEKHEAARRAYVRRAGSMSAGAAMRPPLGADVIGGCGQKHHAAQAADATWQYFSDGPPLEHTTHPAPRVRAGAMRAQADAVLTRLPIEGVQSAA